MAIPQKEKEVMQLEADLAQGLGPTLKQLKHCKPPDNTSKVNPKIVCKLKFYEELVWVLQQQPCYMASLSTCIGGNTDPGAITFMNTASCIYSELEDSRTCHLFMAMMKLCIDKEVDTAKDLDSLFKPENSTTYLCFTAFVM